MLSPNPKPRKSLAYVVGSLDPGGTEKLVCEMSVVFAVEYDVSVICLDRAGAWASSLRAQGIRVVSLWRQPGIDLRIAFLLARFFRKHSISVVHAHQYTPWFYCGVARLFSARWTLIFQEHGRFYPETRKRLRVLFNRIVLRRVTAYYTAVSQDIRTRLEKFEGIPATEIDVVYNGVREAPVLSSAERMALRTCFGFRDADCVIGTIGRFDPVKDIPLLVRNLVVLVREESNVRGLLVGDGPTFAAVQDQVRGSGTGNRIVLSGHREDARKLVQCIDLFVLTSQSEGTSLALLEAMEAGVPAIVTDVGGNPEVVTHGLTGWIVPPGSSPPLMAALRAAVHDSAERRQRGEAGRLRYLELFSMKGMIERYRHIYRRLLSSCL